MKIQEMSNEALLKRKKLTEVVTATLAGLLTILLIAALFLCFKKEFFIGLPLLMMPLSLSAIVFINIADVRAVKKELQTRDQVL